MGQIPQRCWRVDTDLSVLQKAVGTFAGVCGDLAPSPDIFYLISLFIFFNSLYIPSPPREDVWPMWEVMAHFSLLSWGSQRSLWPLIHTITESEFGLENTLKIIQFQHSMGRGNFHLTRSLRTPSSHLDSPSARAQADKSHFWTYFLLLSGSAPL